MKIRRYLRCFVLAGYCRAYPPYVHTVKLVTEAFQPQVFLRRKLPVVNDLYRQYRGATRLTKASLPLLYAVDFFARRNGSL